MSRHQRWLLGLAAGALAAAATWAAARHVPPAAALCLGLAAGAWVAALVGHSAPVLPGSPAGGGDRTERLRHELVQLAEQLELQRGVFEVSAELVGCVEEGDARARFSAALRRYWSCSATDLLVWERGRWRNLGGESHGDPPDLANGVTLPEEPKRELVLDLSPGVDGQAAVVLREASPQPSLRRLKPEGQRYVAEVLRSQLALSLRRVMLYGGLQALARTDPLTGAHRRWYVESRLRELVESGEVLSVAMVDIDRFKTVNDQLGHAAGDEVLAAVGRCLMSWLRSGDLVSRHGGEEFLVMLPETPPAGAQLVAERLRAGIAALDNVPCPVTVSIGVACCLQDESMEELVGRADAAMYEAKAQGRNRVVMAAEPDGSLLRVTAKRNRTTTSLVRRLK
jgi:diguanylate cyclase (GGDEF)-like protein